jgi:hypothetical protein
VKCRIHSLSNGGKNELKTKIEPHCIDGAIFRGAAGAGVRKEKCEQRHPADFAAAQAGAEASQNYRVLEGTDDAARSGDGIMASPNKEMQKDASCTTVPQKKVERCAACRQAHRSEKQCAEGACAARSEPCEACRTGRRSAAECAVRHPQVFAAAKRSRGREAADVVRSGGQAMPIQLIQTVRSGGKGPWATMRRRQRKRPPQDCCSDWK